MKSTTSAASVALLAAVSAYADRTFTVTNNCAVTIWPALFTDLNAGTAVPSQATGWEAAAGTSVTFSVPDNWTAGRIWGRTDCDFSEGDLACSTGACNGGLECDTSTGTGVPPATLAEFTLDGSGSDWFDVSIVDGFNLPVTIVESAGCGSASCPTNLNTNCPTALQTISNGVVVGCKSDCLVDSDPSDSPSCCSGSYDTAATCPSSGVPDYSYFKDGCPDSYVYAYDESSGTALWQCDGTVKPNYSVTFCP
ncbi:Osmotin, thaumatin-like protein [Clavulina sp. PMI_390]|nr:Osmotin, thaumatin-like protein [Clavulina sp. PMI_390]